MPGARRYTARVSQRQPRRQRSLEAKPTMSNPWQNYKGLPPFDHIDAAALGEAVTDALTANRAALAALASEPTGGAAALVSLMDDWSERLHRAFSPLSHLHAVADSPAMREAYEQALPAVINYSSELGQHRGLYEALTAAAASAEAGSEEARVIELALRDFRLAGVSLPEAGRERVRSLSEKIARAQSLFDKNVLDATEGFTLTVTDEARLDGLPDSVRRAARRTAEARGVDGWQFTLMLPSYLGVMMHARSGELRQQLYEAFVTRASECGPLAGQWDNSELMVEILRLRRALARELDYDSYAGYSLATKMAGSPAEVIGFLQDLARRARPYAERELAELAAFAASEFGAGELQAWDIPYYSEQLRQRRFDLSDEVLREYFPLPRVLQGLFTITESLYGVRITPATAPVWHEDVQFFHVHDAHGQLQAMFYLDLYARTGKRGGAWMDDCLIRRRLGDGVQPPVAYLNCNFTEPEPDRPALLSHQDVTTLFHEFGHGLHHMLTRISRGPISGINGVAWDAVELPSQLMENWCWERESLDLISAHVDSGQPLPEAMFEQLLASRRFQAGMQMLRQIEFALFDMRLHSDFDPDADTGIQGLLDAVRAEVAVVSYPPCNRFQNGFSHIFAGGYAAGYYSYKWAEVLAADTFSAFEQAGILDRATGQRFLDTLLCRGGLRDPMTLFRDFMGREPKVDALLHQAGIDT